MFACVENLVLRVAVLYGIIESLSESAVTTLFSDVLACDITWEINNVQLRYPTHCDDVAVVIRQLIDKRVQVRYFYSTEYLSVLRATALMISHLATWQCRH